MFILIYIQQSNRTTESPSVHYSIILWCQQLHSILDVGET